MRKIEYTLYIAFLFVLAGFIPAGAQTISVSAPSRVSAGENFRVSYTVSTEHVDDFRSGIHSNDIIEVIAGPYTSRQSSYQMINGHTSSSSSITYTYTLYAIKDGTFTLPSAHAKCGDKTLTTSPRKITVSGMAKGSGNGAPKMHEDDDDGSQMRSAGTPISGKDLFIKVSANKQRVHEQEPILLTYKVYTLLDLTQLEGKMPDLTGFHTQEVKLPQQKSFHVENVNGRNYRCVTWSQYVMYPQMTGRLEIPSITFKGIVVQQNRSVDPFEAFFNGGSGYVEVKREIKAPGLTVQVDPLPKRPAGFSGGVGRFNISAQVNHMEVKAGDPINMRVVIGGIGNLKLLKQPVISFPKDFDKYDPKVTDKTRLTANGVEGNMIYDFLVVPRNQGKYTVPPVEFTYYDTNANAYKTLKTQAFDINVLKGDGKGEASSVDYSQGRANDIRGLKTGDTRQYQISDFFFGSTAYWCWLLLPLAAFVALLIVFRQRAIDNADVVKMKGKKANKVALKRLRTANRLLLAGDAQHFYDEVLRALYGYVGDKLNMPSEQLSRENIADKLQGRGVDAQTVDTFISALDECEYERYAPGDATGNMSKTYESAMTAIMKIEDTVTSSRRRKKPVAILLLVFLLLSAMPVHAITKANADAEYAKGNYQQAIKDYQELLKQGVSADIYYNLGNAYFRTDNITQAVLAYERAYMLNPGDDDIRFNLQFVRSKTIDKITPQSEMFFFTWYRSIVNFMSVDRWATTAVVSIIFVLVLLLLYLFSSRDRLCRVGFFGAVVFLLLFAFSNLFAWQQRRQLLNRMGAIVVAPTVNVKNTPALNGTDDFVIHEGTKVDIVDKSMKDWRMVRLADGREGWLQTRTIEEI